MRPAFLAVLLTCAPSFANTPTSWLKEMEKAVSAAGEKDPVLRRSAEEKLRTFSRRFEKSGLPGARSLAAYLESPKNPLLVRLHAAAFLGSIKEPESLSALKRVSKNPKEDPGLRAAAIQAIGSLPIDDKDLRPIFESFLDPASPGAVEREALGQLASRGALEPKRVLACAKRLGASPKGAALAAGQNAARALEKSLHPESEEALLDLYEFQRNRSLLRTGILESLSRRGLVKPISRKALEIMTRALFDDDPRLSLQGARLLSRFAGPRALEPLLRTLETTQSPAILGEAAEALASLGDPKAAAPLARLHASLPKDRRFADDPSAGIHAARIEQAAAVFAVSSATMTAAGFSYEGWPGSGQPVIVWKGEKPALSLRSEPSLESAEAAPLPLAPGRRIYFSESLVKTKSPGLSRAKRQVVLEASSFGAKKRLSAAELKTPVPISDWSLPADVAIEILAYSSAGKCFLRRLGDASIFQANCPDSDFETLTQPKTEWWLKLSMDDREGWFLGDDPGLEFREREF